MADPAQINPTLESAEGSDDNRLRDAAQMNPTRESPDDTPQMNLTLDSPGDLRRHNITLQMDPMLVSPEGFAFGLDSTQMDPTLQSPECPTDCRSDFADDVIDEVYPWITGVFLPNPRTRSPVNPKFKLLSEHKVYIQNFLEKEGNKLMKYVGEKRGEKPWLYTDEKYKEVKRNIVNKYKPKVYSEKGFVRLCAAVAFAAIGNQSLQENKDVAEMASEELYDFICEVLKPGGNIHHSEWAEDLYEQGTSGAEVGESELLSEEDDESS